MYDFNVDNYSFEISLEDIDTIVIFGSHARGESDENSDLDLLFIIEDCDEISYLNKKISLQKQLDIPFEWISLYTKNAINNMCEYGSYFLWHLKTECKIFYSKTQFLEKVLENIKPYRNTYFDLMEYSTICNDIRESIGFNDKTYNYELNILASIARNTCIALAYINNKISFGRIQPVKTCIEDIGIDFPFNIKEYIELYNFRIVYNRKLIIPNLKPITKEYINSWVDKLEILITRSLDILKRGIERND
ncbi:nucleotidyltransferase domain-containing protein [Desulfosporosinus nitroreducens]|uniref:nucleotidyltransferase domain-containing protein n=1 Tax=Desulfosporosinus nitroreducens TaxID=2018668 RepID=UPI00207C49FE|nr:nucleotidyltransferase domain-containing protein [Desulfosporosinus nitroreducens]MCO1600017.1 nucleotidyltransferase domain-containing protein [Desulfosporosinus nitroreducens]